MKQEPKPTSAALLSHSYSLVELETIFRTVPEDELRKYIARLHHQLSIAERVLDQRFDRPRHWKELNRARLVAELRAMSVADLRRYIKKKQPYYWVARRVLSVRLSSDTSKAKLSSLKARPPTSGPATKTAKGESAKLGDKQAEPDASTDDGDK